MSRHEEIRKQIQEHWADNPVNESICLKLLDHIIKRPTGVRELTLSKAERIVGKEFDDSAILECLFFLYLHLRILAIGFRLYDPMIDDFIEIDKREVIEAEQLNLPLIHPETGDELHDWRKQVLMYFTFNKNQETTSNA